MAPGLVGGTDEADDENDRGRASGERPPQYGVRGDVALLLLSAGDATQTAAGASTLSGSCLCLRLW